MNNIMCQIIQMAGNPNVRGSAFIPLKKTPSSNVDNKFHCNRRTQHCLCREELKGSFLRIEEYGLKILEIFGRNFFSLYGYCSDQESTDPNEVMGQLKVKQAKEDNRD